MSVRQGLLVLLAEQPAYGSRLRSEFERRTGDAWPLNIGQVYTTPSRLQRDELVEEGDRRDDGTVLYRLTDAGRQEADRWWLTPVPRGEPTRDELAIKLALAVTSPGVDVTALDAAARPSGAGALPPVLQLRDVRRVHGNDAVQVTALAGVSLDLHPGELVAVMGPSGSGESSLLHLAGGLDTSTSGRVVLDGVDLGGLSARARAAIRRRTVGHVFQELNLVPALTAAENVMLPRELDGVATRQARREAWAALGEVGVRDLADRFPDEMSGGQQQRVAIARALVGPRRVVLADEPTGALDSATGEQIMRVLRTRVDAGAAGLLVTHEARFAAWADRVLLGSVGGTIAGYVLVVLQRSGPAGFPSVPGDPSDWPFVVPWPFVVGIVVGIPVVTVLVAMVTARTRDGLTRRLAG